MDIDSQIEQTTYLANFVGITEIINIMPTHVVFLTANQWMHGTRLSTKCCNRRDVSSAVLDLKGDIYP